MAWNRKCKKFAEVRKAIEEERMWYVFDKLKEICDDYSKEDWDWAENYADLKEEMEEVDVDELDDEGMDYWLNEFYDLCDSARVWLELEV